MPHRHAPAPAGARLRGGLGAVCLLAVAVLPAVQLARLAAGGSPVAWGWDESMHAELPAARIALHLARGEVGAVGDVVHGCDQYPFVWPAALGVVQSVLGIGEGVARWCGALLWYLAGVAALAALGGRVGRQVGFAAGAALLAPLAALLSPLAARYAPTLYLEVPALVACAMAVRAWLVRRERGDPARRRRAEFAVGAWLALAFFTKFNYGLLVAAGLALDGLVELAGTARRGRAREWLRGVPRLAAVPLVLCLWWFVLPLPNGPAAAAEHRAAFAGFVTGNLEMPPTPGWQRGLFWIAGVAPHAAVLALFAIGALASLPFAVVPGVRTMWLVFLAGGLPVWLHPFQLDRFLLPGCLALWVLVGVGWAALGRSAPRVSIGLAAAGAVAWALVPNVRVASWLGFPLQGGAVGAYQRRVVHGDLGLFGPPAANGLPRHVHDELLDRIAGAVGPDARVGWLGQSQEMSPAALHLGLLERGGSVERFLADAHRPMDLTPVPQLVDPELGEERVRELAGAFDRVLLATPPDLKARASRAWVADAWHAPLRALADARGWRVRDLGVVEVPRPPAPPATVELELVETEDR